MNLYEYCWDDPLAYTDPNGNEPPNNTDPFAPFLPPNDGNNNGPQPLIPGAHCVPRPDGSCGPNGPVSPGVPVPPYYTPGQIDVIKPIVKPYRPPEVPDNL